jgi:hypothetical protein
MAGAESDADMAASVKSSGNVILLADATYEGAVVGEPPSIPDAGYRLDADGIPERKVVFPPFDALAGAAAGLGTRSGSHSTTAIAGVQ